jgi:riboflavin synthase
VFTGIIETMGTITRINSEHSNKTFTLSSPITSELKIDQSVSHNGVCLTVVAINGDEYSVTAIDETLTKTNLNHWLVGHLVNLERCMQANGRYDGHIVQGHVDTTATCTSVEDAKGSWLFTFELPALSDISLIVNKGSVCINGISLTIVKTEGYQFSVAIIPYTFEHTNMKSIQTGSIVNIEFDIVGKYIAKMLASRK